MTFFVFYRALHTPSPHHQRPTDLPTPSPCLQFLSPQTSTSLYSSPHLCLFTSCLLPRLLLLPNPPQSQPLHTPSPCISSPQIPVLLHPFISRPVSLITNTTTTHPLSHALSHPHAFSSAILPRLACPVIVIVGRYSDPAQEWDSK